MTGDGGRQTWTVRLARRAVQDVAPDELPQFAVVSQAYLAASEVQRQRAVRRAEPLGLGLEGVAVMLTTAALAVAAQVSRHLAEELVGRGVDAAGRGLQARWRRWRARRRRRGGAADAQGTAGGSLPVLTPEQLTQVRGVAVRAGLRQRLPEPLAHAVADGIVAELATAPAAGGATGVPGAPDDLRPGGEAAVR